LLATHLKDDRLGKGSEIKITLADDGKTAKTIQLPFRKQPAKDKDQRLSSWLTRCWTAGAPSARMQPAVVC
jgi:hypothetical protein